MRYDFGAEMHEGQLRKSGEPYFTHPVAVATILTEQRLDDATIITALLHDTIEDTKASYSLVAEQFGRRSGRSCGRGHEADQSAIARARSRPKQAENFRKLFMAMSKDLRVILVKLADRLHNMRTIKYQKLGKAGAKGERDDGHLCAACGADGHALDARRAGGSLAFKVLNADGRQSIIRRFVNAAAGKQAM